MIRDHGSNKRSAIVIGAGLCGPAVSIALQSLADVDCTIYESYERPTCDVGSYFTVTSNGVAVLDQLGVRDAVEKIAIDTRGGQMRNDKLTLLGKMNWVTMCPGESTRAVALTLKRPALNRVLCNEAERRGIPVHFKKKLVSIHQVSHGSKSKVRAVFSDGTESVDADMLIGADGIHSSVRSWLDASSKASSLERYVGLVNFAGEIDQKECPLDCRKLLPQGSEPGYWQFIFGKSAFFLCLTPNTSDDKIVWGVNCPRDKPFSAEERRALREEDACKQFVVDLFKEDACGPLVSSIVNASTIQLYGDPTFDLPHVPMWNRGCVALVGDAVHAPAPTSGQGASMALEDAVILAKALRDNSEHEEAFRAFAAFRRPRVERIVEHGAKYSKMKTPGPVGRWMRDLMLPIVFKYFVSEQDLAWIYNFRIDAAAPLQDDALRQAEERADANRKAASWQRRTLLLGAAAAAVALFLRKYKS